MQKKAGGEISVLCKKKNEKKGAAACAVALNFALRNAK